MASGSRSPTDSRLAGLWDTTRSSFGFPSAVAIVLGLVAGFGMPTLDELLLVDIPAFEFDSQDAARSVLETVATVTVAVAGLAFSVTVVAFTLAANQLSPRVLRSFRTDRLVQITLAVFLGSFIYCLVVLVRLGAVDEGPGLPNLSITLAVVLAIASFMLFAAFIAHIVTMLQPSSVIEAIRRDAEDALRSRYPAGVGREPEDRAETARLAPKDSHRSASVVAEDQGYLTLVAGEAIIEQAASADAVVRQRIRVGDYVLPDQPLAEIWAEDPDSLEDAIRGAFVLARQRTFVQDAAFGVRQLADIALKGLSPGINDPTTAENAMEAMTGVLIRFANADHPAPVRVDDDGVPRFVALTATLDDLVRLGFEQVRGLADSEPVFSARLLELLERLGNTAERNGLSRDEIERQSALIRPGPGGS